MVNPKRIEQKLTLMITTGFTFSYEYEQKDYLLHKFKKTNPSRYEFYLNKIINNYMALEKEVSELKRQRCRQKMLAQGYSGDPLLFNASVKKREPWRF